MTEFSTISTLEMFAHSLINTHCSILSQPKFDLLSVTNNLAPENVLSISTDEEATESTFLTIEYYVGYSILFSF
ncbi:expressed protein [Dictyostelium purpureum]|uniref:Expressed protein n=1 Tax=Dictyostelium purpureum TaxID=5786 RepID=F0ZKA5_DICPU|nr:uncharacterized protein DICPUDRAFT_152024 [Dictyostelium purpureum]EGC35625.1 expressed protein [Dictyostelium purpureum]|eukprot:XP_003287862.1 expressed protein [Dictyostelium purpureum]